MKSSFYPKQTTCECFLAVFLSLYMKRSLNIFLLFGLSTIYGVVMFNRTKSSLHCRYFFLGCINAWDGFRLRCQVSSSFLLIMGSIIIMIIMFIKSPTFNQPPPPSPINQSYASSLTASSSQVSPFQKSGFKDKMSQNLQGTNLIQQHFKWTIQQVKDESDPTIALTININNVPGQKKRFLDIESFSTYLINYGGTDFPTGISLCCSQIAGYVNELRQPTNIVCCTMPTTIGTVLNAGGIIGYNILYNTGASVIWDITNINVLTFKLKLFGDGDYRPLPSAQPLQILAKITRVIF